LTQQQILAKAGHSGTAAQISNHACLQQQPVQSQTEAEDTAQDYQLQTLVAAVASATAPLWLTTAPAAAGTLLETQLSLLEPGSAAQVVFGDSSAQQLSHLEFTASTQSELVIGDLQLPQLQQLQQLRQLVTAPKPDFNSVAFRSLDFLVHHPLITLGLSVAVSYIVPRAVRAATRWLVVPALVVLALYLAVSSPAATFGFIKTVLGFAISHPVVTSAAILVVLALTLSPYILLAAGAALLLGGSTILPGAIRSLVPKPVQELDRQLGKAQQQIKGPVTQAARSITDLKTKLLGGRKQALVAGFIDSKALLPAPSVSAETADAGLRAGDDK
jgi:CheY-like chemotaxis protein